MITPELIAYIRGEFAKGRTREETRKGLATDGGWGEADLSEAFRIVIPMQGFTGNAPVEKAKSPSVSSSSLRKIILIVVIVLVVGAFGFAGWFYRAPLLSLWNSLVNNVTEVSTSFFGSKKTTETTDIVSQNNTLVENTVSVKDCGISIAPDLKNPLTYENNAVLNCLGDSALYCIPARAVLKDDLFPTIFQIIQNKNIGQETCNFKLSYGGDSTLIDVTGRKLALQYISCPLSIVKAVDESKKVPLFNIPSIDNLSKYASQIYFYGTLGVFMENNLDKNMIHNFGCSGLYIDSVIASYQQIQSGR